MQKRGGGRGRITNSRAPRWSVLAAMRDTQARYVWGERLRDFFYRLKDRAGPVDVAVREAVLRAKYRGDPGIRVLCARSLRQERAISARRCSTGVVTSANTSMGSLPSHASLRSAWKSVATDGFWVRRTVPAPVIKS